MKTGNAAHPGMRRWGLLGVATLILGTACQERRPEAAHLRKPRPTPGPSFVVPVTAAPRAQLLSYARSLGYDIKPPAADSQYMLVKKTGGQFGIGPLALLAPESGSAAVAYDSATRGRVVARLWLDSPHPDIPLPAGNSYIWVDSTGSAWRAVLIPEDSSARIVIVPLKRTAYGPADTLWYAVARLTPPPNVRSASRGKDGFCVPCDNGFCCSAGGF